MHCVLVKPLKTVFLWSLLLLLAACSTTATPEIQDETFDRIASVELTDLDTKASIEATYGGNAFIFDKEAGFAMLGFSAEEAGLTTLATDSNTNALATPAVSIAGYSSWAGGHSAWAGGFSAWAGGWSAWAGGNPVPPPSENNSVWDAINLKQAHEISRNYGQGIIVAVLDTGIDKNHPSFKGRLTSGTKWKDFIRNSNNPVEGSSSGKGYGHGTAAASIILQIAPKAQILPIRVLKGDGRGDLDDVIKGIYHAVNQGAHVINISLGSQDFSSSLLTALAYAKSKGVYIVASAGNEGKKDGLLFPARTAWWTEVHPYMISVLSVDNNDYVTGFSNYGANSMISAPGANNYSAYPGGKEAYFRGTSFSAPIVAGALALALSDTPAAHKGKMYDALAKSAYHSTDYWTKNSSKHTNYSGLGHGRLDVADLIRAIPGWSEPSSRFTSSKNLIKNPSFESSFNNWWRNGSTSLSTSKKAGSYAAQVQSGSVIGQTITGLKPNTSYTLIGWGKVSNGGVAYLGVDKFGGPDFNNSFERSSYQSKSLTFKTGSNSTSVSVYFHVDKGTGYLDNLRLIQETW